MSAYSFFNWLPTVLTGVGLPITAALRGSLVFNLGGVIGALIMATCMTRFGSRPVIVTFSIAAIAMTLALAALINSSDANSSLAPLLSLMLLTGLAALGVQVGLYTLAAYVYPTSCRASGVGAAVGIGRLGGIISSFAGAAALAIGNGTSTFFVGICAVLVARSTSSTSRVLALDLLVLVLIGELALIAGRAGRPYALDAALALALLSFVSTIAACRYLEDRRPFT